MKTKTTPKTKAPAKDRTAQLKRAFDELDPGAAASTPADYRREDTTLPLACLIAGDNDRTDFPEEHLADLAASIAAHGILSRLWVRPLDTPTKAGATHALIAGECRWRAAQRTPLLIAPVTVFHCTAEQAAVLTIIENLQRENLNALDEAHGFRKLIDRGWQPWNPDAPERSVGHKVGKSKTYIYSALKLTELSKTGQAALRSGELSASVGIRLARIPDPALQAQALARALRDGWTDADAADEIARTYMTELKGAPFDRADRTLNRVRGSCDACPLRSGNQKEMFADLAKGRADICTDPACFRGKCESSFVGRAKAHLAAGGRVLSASEAKAAGLGENWSNVGGASAALGDLAYGVGDYTHTWRQLLQPALAAGDYLPALALARDGTARHYELDTKERLLAACKALGIVSKKSGTSSTASDRAAKLEKERDKAIVRHQLGTIATAGHIWAEQAAPLGQPASTFLAVIADWLLRAAGPDALRLICQRRQIDSKAFRLIGGGDTPAGRMQAALGTFLESADFNDTVGLICELMAVPSWIPNEGELDADHLAALGELLGFLPAEIYVKACHALKTAEKTALGQPADTLL